MGEQPKIEPRGIVLVFIDEKGHAIAHAADFDDGGDARRYRARRALARAVVDAYASPALARGLDQYACEQAVQRLCQQYGCRVHEIVIGGHS